MQLKFNSQETNNYSTQGVYIQYKKWLLQNGVKVDPRIRYPSYFGEKNKGVVGVSVNAPIEKKRVVIAVPYNLLITMDKVMSVQILKQIITTNSDVFGVSQHAVMKMLILFVCFELLKGKQSFYYPYLQICKDSYLQKWTHWQMVALQNKQLTKALKRQKQQIQLFFLQFLRLFTKYESVFPSDKGNAFYQKLFQRAYTFVTTRAFGWSLPSISLIPMADSLNHGNNYLTHYLIDTQEQRKPSETYVSYLNKSNLSIFKNQGQIFIPSESKLGEFRKKKKRRYQKFIQKHKQIIQSSKQIGQISSNSKIQNSTQRNKQFFILSQQYKSQVRTLRQLKFYESSCSQDNDTDQDQLTEFVTKREKFQFEEKYRINSQKNNKQNFKKQLTKKYWKLWTDNTLDQDESLGDESQEDKKQTSFSQEGKQALQNYAEKHKQSEGSSSVSSTESEQDDEIFDWMEPHAKQQYKNCYFTMQTRQIVRQNEQINNFYGRRTNRFLLQAYNFVMANNQYDSFGFRLYTDSTINVKPNTLDRLVCVGSKKQSTQKSISCSVSREIRLKRQHINLQLINHCRCYTIQFQKKQYPFVSVTVPFDREIEVRTLKLYRQIIQFLQNQYMTDREDDLQLLQKTVQYQLRTAISYRFMQKQILACQLELIDKCIQFLNKKWKNARIQKHNWKDMKTVIKIRQYANSLERGNIQ